CPRPPRRPPSSTLVPYTTLFRSLFELAGMQEEERFEHLACLAGLERTERAPFAIARSYGFEYRYLPQDTRIGEGDVCRLAQNVRSEEHTSELQSREDLVCRLPLE